jgi:hypothetical protein
MPGGNRRGPWDAGPLTGRSAGYCAGHPVPGYMNAGGSGRGRGWGRGRGLGLGWRHGAGGWGRWDSAGTVAPASGPGPWYGAFTPSRDAELSVLREQASHTEGVLKDIRRRITELERETTEDQ